MNITLRPIDESNFIDCFNLQLGDGQDKSYPTPYAVWLKPMFTVISASPSECTPAIPWQVTSW